MHVISTFCFCSRFQLCVCVRAYGEKNDYKMKSEKKPKQQQQQQN